MYSARIPSNWSPYKFHQTFPDNPRANPEHYLNKPDLWPLPENRSNKCNILKTLKIFYF
jgi:hypothetical protein